MAQIVKTDSDEIVILTRREYDALMARLGDDDAEDRMSARLALEARGEPLYPAWLAEKMMSGISAVRAARHRAGLTQSQAAARAGIGQGYFNAIENGRKRGSAGTIRAIAAALDVEPGWLRDEREPAAPLRKRR